MVLGLADVLLDVAAAAPHEGPPATSADLAACIGTLAVAIEQDRLLSPCDRWEPGEISPQPELFWREIHTALTSVSGLSRSGLRHAACFLAEYAVRHRVRHTAAEALSLVLEEMRAEGLRTMKKWRPWQTHKSMDRMSGQTRFMFAIGGHGTVDFKMSDLPKFRPPELTEQQKKSIQIEVSERVADLVGSMMPAAELAQALLRVAEELPDCLSVGPYSCEPFEARLNGLLVYLENVYERTPPLDSETASQWAVRVIGDPASYVVWREQRASLKAAKLELRECKEAGHDPLPEHRFLRPSEHLCPRCGYQTFLVAEQVRRVDEACEWHRICVRCGTRERQ